jgi:hypothetical protein
VLSIRILIWAVIVIVGVGLASDLWTAMYWLIPLRVVTLIACAIGLIVIHGRRR